MDAKGELVTSIVVMLIGLSLVVLGLITWRRRAPHTLGLLLGIFLMLAGVFTIWLGSNLDIQYTTESEAGATCQDSGSPIPGMPQCDDMPR